MADKVVGINRGSIYLTMEISGVKLREDKIEIINNPVEKFSVMGSVKKIRRII